MFSDSHRIFKIALLLAALLGSCLYANFGRDDLTLQRCLSDPVYYDGAKVPIYVDARIVKFENDRLLVTQPGGPVEIRVPPDLPKIVARPGEFFEALTIFRREGYLELQQIRTAPWRKIKIALSIFPILAVAWLLARTVGWEGGRFFLKS